MPHRVKEFHSIMPIVNIISVLERGILCHKEASSLIHADFSMAEIQERRQGKSVPNGLSLHEYVNLYFDAWNPMMCKLREKVNSICVLRVSKSVLNLAGVVVTDQNASSDYVVFLSPDEIAKLKLDQIYSNDWRHPQNKIAYFRHKAAKCAEILVPKSISPDYIDGAYVVDSSAENQLKNSGFTGNIEIKPALFFGEG